LLGEKYISLYEKMTGGKFQIPKEADVKGRIEKNLKKYLGV